MSILVTWLSMLDTPAATMPDPALKTLSWLPSPVSTLARVCTRGRTCNGQPIRTNQWCSSVQSYSTSCTPANLPPPLSVLFLTLSWLTGPLAWQSNNQWEAGLNGPITTHHTVPEWSLVNERSWETMGGAAAHPGPEVSSTGRFEITSHRVTSWLPSVIHVSRWSFDLIQTGLHKPLILFRQ